MPVSKVSVIIPHWNGIDILADCLESLKKNTYPNIEIIVVDNASTDGSSEWISSHYPDTVSYTHLTLPTKRIV